MRDPKTHLADLLYGRACCGSESTLVTNVESEATCKRCLNVMHAHPCPVHGDAHHGGEAEELRKGVERLRDSLADHREYDGYDIRDRLQTLLDDVDARDSLAWLERHDEKREAEVDQLRARIAELEAAHV